MFPCIKSIINLLAILCLVCQIRPLKGQMYNYSRLCGSLSKMATRQYVRLCEKNVKNLDVVRVKRGVRTTQQTFNTTAQAQVTTTKKPTYECKDKPTSKNGFSPDGHGLHLTMKCTIEGYWYSANITWKVPKPAPSRADCVGYRVEWFGVENYRFCDYIPNKNQTSYVIDSSKKWDMWEFGDNNLYVVVFPLPATTNDNAKIHFRTFQTTECSDPAQFTTTDRPLQKNLSSLPLPTTLPAEKHSKVKNTEPPTVNLTKSGAQSGNPHTVSETPTVNHTKSGLPSKNQHSVSVTRPAVNKVVFSIVISSIAVLIVVILFVIYKRKRKPSDRKNNRTSEGPTHYISYNANDKSDALDIARWLQQRNVNVIIDKLCFIVPNRRAWSERQLLEAKKIIMIVSPKYLEICNFDQSMSHREKICNSFYDDLVYNEIALIRDKLIEQGMAAEKFVGILIGTKRNDLPHWMSQFNCYQYKNGKVDEDILRMLKPGTWNYSYNDITPVDQI